MLLLNITSKPCCRTNRGFTFTLRKKQDTTLFLNVLIWSQVLDLCSDQGIFKCSVLGSHTKHNSHYHYFQCILGYAHYMVHQKNQDFSPLTVMFIELDSTGRPSFPFVFNLMERGTESSWNTSLNNYNSQRRKALRLLLLNFYVGFPCTHIQLEHHWIMQEE